MKYKGLCVSVGAFTADEALSLINDSTLLYVFEPNPDARNLYIEKFAGYDNVNIRPEAISSKHMTSKFYLSGKASSLIPTKECDTIDVEVIPLVEVIDEIITNNSEAKKVLAMNCEGAEIDIIENTPMESLEVFDIISIEFHPHVSLQVEIQQCIDKLSEKYSRSVTYGSVSKHPRYCFRKMA